MIAAGVMATAAAVVGSTFASRSEFDGKCNVCSIDKILVKCTCNDVEAWEKRTNSNFSYSLDQRPRRKETYSKCQLQKRRLAFLYISIRMPLPFPERTSCTSSKSAEEEEEEEMCRKT